MCRGQWTPALFSQMNDFNKDEQVLLEAITPGLCTGYSHAIWILSFWQALLVWESSREVLCECPAFREVGHTVTLPTDHASLGSRSGRDSMKGYSLLRSPTGPHPATISGWKGTMDPKLIISFWGLLKMLFGNWRPRRTEQLTLSSLHIVNITLVVMNVIQTSPGVQIKSIYV